MIDSFRGAAATLRTGYDGGHALNSSRECQWTRNMFAFIPFSLSIFCSIFFYTGM
jgi:hypothetical protein